MNKEIKYGILAAISGVVVYYLVKIGIYTKERMESQFEYFTFSEFDSPDEPGSGETHMDEAFIYKLDAARKIAGIPFIITSGYRTESHNEKVGGVANSSHIKGLAADIAALTDEQKYAIAGAAVDVGINRIGWGRTFIHLDVDPDKTQNIVWNYGNSAPSFNELRNLA